MSSSPRSAGMGWGDVGRAGMGWEGAVYTYAQFPNTTLCLTRKKNHV